jgi:hypothetical protein
MSTARSCPSTAAPEPDRTSHARSSVHPTRPRRLPPPPARPHPRIRTQAPKKIGFSSDAPGTGFDVAFTGTRVVLVGQSRPDGAYANVELADRDGTVISLIYVTFYSKVPDCGYRYASPVLPRGEYTLTVTVLGEPTEWSDKRGERFGSVGTRVTVDSALVLG